MNSVTASKITAKDRPRIHIPISEALSTHGAHSASMSLTQNEAIREAVKVGLAFKALQSGLVSTMSEEDFQKFMAWLA